MTIVRYGIWSGKLGRCFDGPEFSLQGFLSCKSSRRASKERPCPVYGVLVAVVFKSSDKVNSDKVNSDKVTSISRSEKDPSLQKIATRKYAARKSSSMTNDSNK